MKKWKSDLLRIDAIVYEAKRRHEHKLKKQKTIVSLKNKRKGGDTE